MEELPRVTSDKLWERNWAVETRLDLETGQSIKAVGQKAIQWGEKKEGSVLDHQFEQLKAMSPKERGRYVEFLGSIGELPEGLQDISDRLAEVEKADLKQKSGHMWDCIGRSDGIYQFRMKPEYESDEAFHLKTKEITPAIEVSAAGVVWLFDTSRADSMILKAEELLKVGGSKSMPLREAYNTFGLKLLPFSGLSQRSALLGLVYEDLGYGVRVDKEGTVLLLPNREVLEERWAKLQEKNSELADLHVLGAAGIATDEAFLEGHVTHNILLSDGKEFIHDHIIHLVAGIELLASLAANGIDYETYKHTVVQGLFGVYKKILSVDHRLKGMDPNFLLTSKELALLKRSIGAVVDVTTAQARQYNSSVIRSHVRWILEEKGDFYQGAVADFSEEFVRRLSLVWDKLDLATAPLYGYPELEEAVVTKLLGENPELLGVCTKYTLFLRLGNSVMKYPSTFVEEEGKGCQLVVDDVDSGLYFSRDIGTKRRVTTEDLRALLELSKTNRKNLRQLEKGIPRSLRRRAEATSHPPIEPTGGREGDFVIWKSKAVYGDSFSLSRVSVREDETFEFQTYTVTPDLRKNQPGFFLYVHGRRQNEEEGFVPAESYEEFLAKMTGGELDGQKLGKEIQA